MKHIKHTKLRMGTAILFMTALLIFSYYHADAQTYLSRQFYFNQNTGTNVVLRENNAGTPIMSYRKNTYQKGLCFIYGEWYAGTAKSFLIMDYSTMNNTTYSYTVHDMRVVGDMCYLCGKRIMQQITVDPETGIVTSIEDSTGILGRFHIPPSGFQGQVSMRI